MMYCVLYIENFYIAKTFQKQQLIDWRILMKKALLVIDVQNEYFTGKRVTYPKGSFENILTAIDFAAENDILVILIQHISNQGSAGAFAKDSNSSKLHPRLIEKPYNYIVEKNLPGSFTNTNLEEILKNNGVNTVVICGYMTQMCCDTTARQAFHMGYKVEFLSNATGTLNFSNYAGTISAEQLHKAILITQAMCFSNVLSTNEWINTNKQNT